ncbi:hypothetical protein AGMMS49546_25810 [Spirochaetia bacterium]|nr:hypothetical protein AGMMS49546_25810 [Spirochaetia bacterium]
MRESHHLRNKIILTMVLYLTVIGIVVNIFLYTYLLASVSAKAERLDRMNLEAVKTRLDRDFAAIFSLAVLCANDPSVIRVVSRRDRSYQESLMDSLEAQDKMNAYLRVSQAGSYVDKLILSGGEGLFVQAQARQAGEFADQDRLHALPLYTKYTSGDGGWAAGAGPSISILAGRNRDSYAIFFPVWGYNNRAEGFIYVEAGLDLVTDVFREYALLPGLKAAVAESESFISATGKLVSGSNGPGGIRAFADGMRFRRDKRSFRLDILPLENSSLVLYNEVDITELRQDDRDVFYTILVVILSSLLAAAGLGLTLSFILTRPIQRLISRIKKIGEKDFSYDPEIGKSRDEIGQIGRAVNEMSGSITRLLAEMEESFRQQKTTEIALLQTRINPHFLYNTLDSIQWMAKIQKNTGIADITRSLINLLRNIAGGSDDLITLEEELRLLDDYTAVMSIRFLLPQKHSPRPALTRQQVRQAAPGFHVGFAQGRMGDPGGHIPGTAQEDLRPDYPPQRGRGLFPAGRR